MRSETIYIYLPEEETDAWRGVEAEVLGGGRYRVLRPDDYDPRYEAWEFGPCTTVHCAMRRPSEGDSMVASTRCGSAPGDQGHVACAVCERTTLDLPDPWWEFDPVAHDGVIEAREAELRREVDPRHGLRADGATAVAGCGGCDEVLYRLADDRLAQVHLTWSYRREEPPYPLTQTSDDAPTAMEVARQHGCVEPNAECPGRMGR
jgi:hypothetical protein